MCYTYNNSLPWLEKNPCIFTFYKYNLEIHVYLIFSINIKLCKIVVVYIVCALCRDWKIRVAVVCYKFFVVVASSL